MAEPAEYAYDVFISYSHKDEAWVTQTLLPRLEKAGLRACIDYRDFRPGAPSLKEMQRAVLESRKTLLVLTPDYVQGAWADFEALVTETLDPANQNLRLIPLLIAECELPAAISYLTYLDFTRPDRLVVAWTMLLTALGAPPPPEPPEEPHREGWRLAHPYPMPPNFTGRAAERGMLSEWLSADGEHPLLLLCALGGFGKSALTWHWLLHDVDPTRWPRVVWWSFYEGDASFDSFLRETLIYLGGDPRSLGPRQQVDALLRLLHQPGTLLILDGFERALRAYAGMDAAYRGDAPSPGPPPRAGEGAGGSERDCINMIAEHFLRSVASLPSICSKVLLTTRLRPRVLEGHGGVLLQGCREEALTQMQPADAVAFFRAQGIRGGRAEIEAACLPYGYHPLSLRLLAGLVANDPQQPGDIAAARRLDVSGSQVQRQHHVLEQAYEGLTPERRRLLSQVACFRGPVGYEALAALAGRSGPRARPGAPQEGDHEAGDHKGGPYDLDADLHDLVERGLLHHDRQTNRYDLHPIVRRYAYDRLAGSERAEAHRRLRDYFAALPPPDKVQTLDDLAPVIELYHHTVRAGQYDEARILYRDRISDAIYFQFGAYQLQIELLRALFPSGEDQPPQLKGEEWQAWTLVALANSYSLSGQPRRATLLFERYNTIQEKRGDKRNLAIGLLNLASMAQIQAGALRSAEANLRRAITFFREVGDEPQEAIGHTELGRLLAYRGSWTEAEDELAVALVISEKEQALRLQGVVWTYRALRALLMSRTVAQSAAPLRADLTTAAVSAARLALELADETARTLYPYERDYVDAHWLLGAAHLANGDPDAAERHLTEALTRCRGINLVEFEADILLDLARLALTPNPSSRGKGAGGEGEAARLAEEALTIAERCGYVLKGADAHLVLVRIALAAWDRDGAREHAQAARRLATCDGPPDYTHQVAYREAGIILGEFLGEPSLTISLVNKKLKWDKQVRVTLELVNKLDHPVKNVHLRMLDSDGYKLGYEDNEQHIEQITVGESQSFGFTVRPIERAATVHLEVTYSLFNHIEHIEFAERIEFVRGKGGFIPVDNPYVVGPPIPPDGGPFVGRQDVFDWIQGILRRPRKSIIVLHGQRRTGKTSILLHLREQLHAPFYPAFLDCQQFVDAGNHMFLHNMSEAISEGLNKQGVVLAPPSELLSKPEIAGACFRSWLKEAQSRIGQEGLIIVMLDEFETLEERVNDRKLDKSIYGYLRSLMQHQAGFTCVLTGTHRLEEMSQDYQSILFNIAHHREISLMERNRAEELIRGPVAPIVNYEDEAVEKLWQLTHGHPYFIQSLCYAILELMNDEKKSNDVSNALVDEAVEHVFKHNPGHLRYLWDQSTQSEQIALATIAGLAETRLNYTVTWEDTVQQVSFYDFSEDELNTVLKRLVTRGLIQPSTWHPPSPREVAYSYAFDLLRLWVYRHYCLGGFSQ